MSPYTFRTATRTGVWVLGAFVGPSGSGKTYSAMKFATGMAGGKRFAVIDTENGRARHYADMFEFDVADLRAPFRPEAYADAIESAAAAGYGVIVVDSFSHEHAGDGGLLDWHEEEFKRLGGRDSVKMTAWIKPKMAHKRMMTRLLQVNAHIIVCLRAEERVEIIDDPEKPGKKKIVPKQSLTGLGGWIPICEKNLPYEMTMSLLLTPDAPGIPKPIKLQEQHRAFVPLDRPIDERAGAALASWAAGGEAPADAPVMEASLPGRAGASTLTKAEREELFRIATECGVSGARLKEILLEVTGAESSAFDRAHWADVVRALEEEGMSA